MDRFDVAVIGAGPEGLIAAILLARAGLTTILLEKESEPGGRAATHELHPGFKASLFADELPAISPRLYRLLNLARNGAILAPPALSACVADGASLIFADPGLSACVVPRASLAGLLALRQEVGAARRAIEARARLISPPARTGLFRRQAPEAPWLTGRWITASLAEVLAERIPDPLLRLHLAADAISGRAVSPFLAGTALHLLAPGAGRSGSARGGLGAIGQALVRIAASAGVILRCQAEVLGIDVRRGRAVALILPGGEEIRARAYVSSLDVKRTFLRLIGWDALPPDLAKELRRFRLAGQAARVLLALDGRPELKIGVEIPDGASGPVHVLSSLEELSFAHGRWRAGRLPESVLVTLRVPSLADPRLAPPGKAVMTATLAPIPSELCDGPWVETKRDRLLAMTLEAAEQAYPGVGSLVVESHIVAGKDVEDALGLTGGDLDGGEFAPDQALDFRPLPGAEWRDGRTPVAALYLAGPSAAPAPVLLGASGERAALAVLADLTAGGRS